MEIMATEIPDVKVIQPRVFKDPRGFFFEIWKREAYEKAGVVGEFIQDNLSQSTQGCLRGLHFQYPRAQAKLVSCLEGEIFDVAVDIRRGSPTFGKWVGRTLSAENRLQLIIPSGFAHGFLVTGTVGTVHYKATDYYSPQDEKTLAWDSLQISWPLKARPILSEKDRSGKNLSAFLESDLPVYSAR